MLYRRAGITKLRKFTKTPIWMLKTCILSQFELHPSNTESLKADFSPQDALKCYRPWGLKVSEASKEHIFEHMEPIQSILRWAEIEFGAVKTMLSLVKNASFCLDSGILSKIHFSPSRCTWILVMFCISARVRWAEMQLKTLQMLDSMLYRRAEITKLRKLTKTPILMLKTCMLS